MAENNNFFDPDDIRNRRSIDMHPMFYWRVVYNRANDNYECMPFMRINNTDSGRADWMDVAVTENHIIRYRDGFSEFMRAQPLNRRIFTREEMMHVQPFREKIEYNKTIILLTPDNPEYIPLISDFSIRLNPENVHTLNALDGEPHDDTAPVVDKTDNRTQNEKILALLSMVADKMDAMDARISNLEHNN